MQARSRRIEFHRLAIRHFGFSETARRPGTSPKAAKFQALSGSKDTARCAN
jgi:hypothetical protein